MQALEGIIVADFTTYLGGAATTMYLGDFGAEVIKVEPPEGDHVRRMNTTPFLGNNSRTYMVMNRNKRGMVLDLNQPQGKEIALKLAERSDVIVEDQITGVMDGLGLGYEAVRQINPRIIYCSIPPFGEKGPYTYMPPNDVIVEGITGLLRQYEPDEPDEPYDTMHWLVGELPVGTLAAYGIVLALLAREETGEGQLVETSILNGVWPMLQSGTGRVERDPAPPLGTPGAAWQYCYYQTKDGAFSMACFTERHWERLCKMAGFEELAADTETWGSQAKRADGTETLRTLFAAKYRQWTLEETAKRFIETGVPYSEVNRWWQLFDHPQVLAQKMMVKVDHPAIGETEIMGCPMTLSEAPSAIRSPAPMLGQHTQEVLADLGCTEAQVAQLKEQQVI